MLMKNYDTIGNRTRDLPACSAVPQPTSPPQLLKPCASIAVQLLYTIPILTVTISVHTVTNMYSSHSC